MSAPTPGDSPDVVLVQHAPGEPWEVDDSGGRTAVTCGQQAGGSCDWQGWTDDHPAHVRDELREAGWVLVQLPETTWPRPTVPEWASPLGKVTVVGSRRPSIYAPTECGHGDDETTWHPRLARQHAAALLAAADYMDRLDGGS